VPASAGTASRHCVTVQVPMRVGGATARPTSASLSGRRVSAAAKLGRRGDSVVSPGSHNRAPEPPKGIYASGGSRVSGDTSAAMLLGVCQAPIRQRTTGADIRSLSGVGKSPHGGRFRVAFTCTVILLSGVCAPRQLALSLLGRVSNSPIGAAGPKALGTPRAKKAPYR